MMGGDVSVDSVEGEGSMFTLTFAAEVVAAPVEKRDLLKGAEQAVVPIQLPGSNALRILLVDDNPINRKVARAFLKTVTKHLTEAENGAEALRQLRSSGGAFDLVLLDMNMPVMNGPETIASIRGEAAAWRDIPVIALTADAMSGDKERYLAMGLAGYASKPIDQNQLLAEINAALASRSA